MARKRKTWEEITVTLTTDKGMNWKDRVNFHYFNPRGKIAQLNDVERRVGETIRAYNMPEGGYLAYGCFAHEYHREQLLRIMRRSAPVKHTEITAILEGIDSAMERAEDYIRRVEAGTHPAQTITNTQPEEA